MTNRRIDNQAQRQVRKQAGEYKIRHKDKRNDNDKKHPHALNLSRLWFCSLQDVGAEADDGIRGILRIAGFKEEVQPRDTRVVRGKALARSTADKLQMSTCLPCRPRNPGNDQNSCLVKFAGSAVVRTKRNNVRAIVERLQLSCFLRWILWGRGPREAGGRKREECFEARTVVVRVQQAQKRIGQEPRLQIQISKV